MKQIYTTDSSTKPEYYYNQKRLEMLAYIPLDCKIILDVGCGEGYFGEELQRKNKAKVWGIEVINKIAKQAEKKLHKVLQGDISKIMISLPKSYFDCIIFNDVLEHMVDPYTILEKSKKLLKKDGIVVCSIPNIRYYEILKEIILHKQWKYREQGILDKGHLRFFTKRSMTEMFEELGYEIVIIEGINPIQSRQYSFINFITCGFFEDSRYLQFACVVKGK